MSAGSLSFVVLLLAALHALANARQIFEAAASASGHHDEGQLVFSHCLWRHGDRTPTAFAPNDPNRSPGNWSVGLGELTALGMQQHYALGQWLRQRYDGWLPHHYSENDIYIRSTDVDRTLASAYSNLAGLYTPKDDQIWNQNLLWQPIPVHTMPMEQDYLLGSKIGCSAYDRLLNDVLLSPEISTFIGKHQELIEYIANNTNKHPTKTIDQLQYVVSVRDTLFVEGIYNKSVPDWTHRIYPSKSLDELALLYYVLPAYIAPLAKLQVGYTLREILDRSVAKVAGKLQPDRKVWAYSAHDLNISTVLFALGLSDGDFVHYAAALLFEVRLKKDGQAYLSIAYRRKADDHYAETLFIPDCGYQCPLSRMYELYADILPTEDYETTCRQ